MKTGQSSSLGNRILIYVLTAKAWSGQALVGSVTSKLTPRMRSKPRKRALRRICVQVIVFEENFDRLERLQDFLQDLKYESGGIDVDVVSAGSEPAQILETGRRRPHKHLAGMFITHQERIVYSSPTYEWNYERCPELLCNDCLIGVRKIPRVTRFGNTEYWTRPLKSMMSMSQTIWLPLLVKRDCPRQ